MSNDIGADVSPQRAARLTISLTGWLRFEKGI